MLKTFENVLRADGALTRACNNRFVISKTEFEFMTKKYRSCGGMQITSLINGTFNY
jgi:hypothetical protein